MEAVGRRAFVVGALLCVWPLSAHAQSQDPIEGVVVGAVRVIGLKNVQADTVEQHLTTRAGQPFHRLNLVEDQRALDELRLFSDVSIEPRLEGGSVVLVVTVAETLRLLPVVLISVTDENGVSAGPGLRGINLFGHGELIAVSTLFGGLPSVGVSIESPTITPGTWRWQAGARYLNRDNTIFNFNERSTTANVRFGRNLEHHVQVGGLAEFLTLDTGSSGASLSPDGQDQVPSAGAFVTLDSVDSSTNPRLGTFAEAQVERLGGDASSWTFTFDGRRFQRLSNRHGVNVFALATLQTGAVGVTLPEYLQYALGGANSIRGWSLASRLGRDQFIGGLEYAFVAKPVSHYRVKGLNFYAGLQVVAFADVGMAWSTRQDFSTQSAITGYGVGLRLQVPFVDLIRMDLAWGEPGRGTVFCFGVSLKATRQRQRVR